MVFQKKLFKVWGLISLVLILLNIVSLFWDVWTRFILILSLGNLLIFVAAFLARKKLNSAFLLLINISKKFDAQVSADQFDLDAKSPRIAGNIFIAFLVIIGVYVCFVAVTNVEKYYWYIHEDNIVESASAICWFAAFVVLLVSIFRYLRQGHINAVTLILYCGLALFVFLCGGEEISWGQRMFKFETPEVLAQLNIQNETNLHNIGSISIFSNAFFLIAVSFFLLTPYIFSKYFKQKHYLKYYLPIVNAQTKYVFLITLFVWIFVGIRFGTIGFHPFSFYEENYYNQMDDEMFEFMTAYSFLCFSVTDGLKRLKQKMA